MGVYCTFSVSRRHRLLQGGFAGLPWHIFYVTLAVTMVSNPKYGAKLAVIWGSRRSPLAGK